MKKVQVVISTYNGEKNIVRQLDSIFDQVDVNVSVYIRDDNSKDGTLEVIDSYIKKYPNKKIEVSKGENIGYAKSFWTALRDCEEADYYAFADQDDIWFSDKLKKSIEVMDDNKSGIPQMTYSKMLRCDEELNPLNEQVAILPVASLSKKIVLTKTYNYGAATVFNNAARKLICRYWPQKEDLPHDLWVGLLCYWFGIVYYVDENLYYWIRYNNSVTGEGTKKSGRLYRIKKTIEGKSYVNVASDLIEYYSDLLSFEDRVFLERIVNYKKNVSDKFRLLIDKDFRRDSLFGTLILKAGVMFGLY